MVDYNIISTGSKGNAVVVDKSILIDCGVPFRALREVYKHLRLVLLTHIHGDHFNRATIRRLAQERPTLRWGCCKWLAAELSEMVDRRSIDILLPGIDHAYGRFIVEPVELVHNVPNCGYKLTSSEFGRVFYATDTNTLSGVSARGYDLYMVEANYNEDEIVERIRRKQAAGEHCYEWDVLDNHLSREKATDWLYANMSHTSRYVYLHEHVDTHSAETGAQYA